MLSKYEIVVCVVLFYAFVAPKEEDFSKEDFRCGCRISRKLPYLKVHADCSQGWPELKCLAQMYLSSMDLSGTGLQKVPDLDDPGFEGIEDLDLSENNITELTDWIFGSIKDLQSINLSHNNLMTLPNKKPKNNTKIDLRFNKLEKMTDLVPLLKTQALLEGNPLLCKCHNSHVKQMYKQFPSFMDNDIKCKMDNSDELKPFSHQCHEIINKDYDSVSDNTGTIIGILILFLIVLTAIASRLR